MKICAPDCNDCLNKNNSIFNNTCLDELKVLDKRKTGHLFKKGHLLFQEGVTPLGIFCIHSGKVKIVKKNNEGKEQIVRIAYPGTIIGFRSILANSPYSASAKILEDSVICFIPRDDFENLVQGKNNVKFELIKRLSVTLGEAEEKIAAMSLKPVRERLAEALLSLNKIYNSDTSGNYFSVSREDIGSLVGTAKETAIRIMAEFKENKIIQTQGSKIKILDMNKLVRISHLHD